MMFTRWNNTVDNKVLFLYVSVLTVLPLIFLVIYKVGNFVLLKIENDLDTGVGQLQVYLETPLQI